MINYIWFYGLNDFHIMKVRHCANILMTNYFHIKVYIFYYADIIMSYWYILIYIIKWLTRETFLFLLIVLFDDLAVMHQEDLYIRYDDDSYFTPVHIFVCVLCMTLFIECVIYIGKAPMKLNIIHKVVKKEERIRKYKPTYF